jgi:hypothetical protein
MLSRPLSDGSRLGADLTSPGGSWIEEFRTGEWTDLIPTMGAGDEAGGIAWQQPKGQRTPE